MALETTSAPTSASASGCSRSARQPTARSARIEAWTSSTAKAGRRSASRGSAVTTAAPIKNVAPLTANTTAVELSSRSAAPRAGPAMTHRLVMPMRAAFAAARSPAPTSRGMTATTHCG